MEIKNTNKIELLNNTPNIIKTIIAKIDKNVNIGFIITLFV